MGLRGRGGVIGSLLACLGVLSGCARDLCHQRVPLLRLPGVPSGVFQADGRAYLFVYSVYERQPRGICRFPDGGRTVTAHEFADFFEMDVEQPRLRHLASFSGGPDFALSSFTGSFGLSHAGDGYVYAYAVGTPRDAETPDSREALEALTRRRYFEIDTGSGQVAEIDATQFERRTRALPPADEARTNAAGQRLLLRHDLDRQGEPEAFSFLLEPASGSDAPSRTLITGLDWLPHGIDYALWAPGRSP